MIKQLSFLIGMERHLHKSTSTSTKYLLPGLFNYIGGKRVSPVDTHCNIKKISPSTGDVICTVPCSGKEEVNRAVETAQGAFLSWSKLSGRQRGQFLTKAAQRIRSRIEEIAYMEVVDTGKPIWEARVDISGCADVLEYYGGVAATVKGDHYDVGEGNFAIIRREPLGVVAGIGAWNYPFQVMTWKAAPALACGNTFVYKPSQLTPLTSVILAEIFTEAGIPPGVVSVIQGDGTTGETLCLHPSVAKVTFTGSVETGKKIAKACANSMKKITMELGGKSALLVFPDCDVLNAVKATLLGNFLTQGEVCSNCTRVFVQRSIIDEFLNKLVAAAQKMVIGNPESNSTMVGAMISKDHTERVLKFIDLAKAEGASIACGGERVILEDPLMKGYFVSPCVLTDCTDDMTVVKEEIFGPVVSVLPFDTEEEAIQRANCSPYGLAAGVMTKDVQRAHRVASSLQAGTVWINNYNIFHPEIPFGGYKLSGYGRENGLAAISDFSQLKSIYMEMNSEISCPIFLE